MRVVKEVRIRFMDREANALALFDAGSSYTVVRRSFLRRCLELHGLLCQGL